MLSYRAALPLSRRTLEYVAGVIRRHREAIGTRRRKLTPGRQALLALVHLRKGEAYTEVAAGFGISVATAWRYVTETVALLAQRAPKLDHAIRAAKKAGYPCLVLDGTLIRIGRVAADRPCYSGKKRRWHGYRSGYGSRSGSLLPTAHASRPARRTGARSGLRRRWRPGGRCRGWRRRPPGRFPCPHWGCGRRSRRLRRHRPPAVARWTVRGAGHVQRNVRQSADALQHAGVHGGSGGDQMQWPGREGQGAFHGGDVFVRPPAADQAQHPLALPDADPHPRGGTFGL